MRGPRVTSPRLLPVLLVGLAACRESWSGSGPPPGTAATEPGEEVTEVLTGTTPPDAPPPADCRLVSDLSDPNFLEGDTVRFTVGCSGSLVTEDAQFKLDTLPEGAVFDTETRVFEWRTGPADGARVDLQFHVLPRDGSTPTPDEGSLTLWVADDPDNPDNTPVSPEGYTEEWGLPVVHLEAPDTLGTADYAEAAVTWYGSVYPSGVQIHGKTSSNYPKQSYRLRFDDDELPVASWGVTRDHLILIAVFDDNSYVRQKFTYDLWWEIANYWGSRRLAPRSFFTVVYLNGSYHGLYMAVDRLDDEFLDQMGFERDANLYKAVDTDANFALTDAEGLEKETLHQGFEKTSGEPPEDFSDLEELVAFTGSATPEELVSESSSWLDLSEMMDALLLLFYSNAEDSYLKNMYIYHDAGGLYRYAPWDFNASWGQNWRTYRVDATYQEPDAAANRVFAALLEDPDANRWMWERFRQMRRLGPFQVERQLSMLDEYYAVIDRSAQRDWDRWGEAHRTYEGWATARDEDLDWTDFEGEKAYMYQWVTDRAAFYESTHP